MEEFCEHLNIAIPPLITLRHAMLVTSSIPLQESLSISELPWYMLSRIMILDSNSRLYPETLFAGNEVIETTSTLDLFKPQKTEKSQSASSVHPMDIFIFIFLRSHPIFRQTLATQVSKCQLSLPLITGINPMLHIFALRTLYKDNRIGDCVSKSYSVVNEKTTFISFIRIGECSRSRKSQILNQIIGIPNYFFHRDQLGSTKTRHLLNGTVEIGWLFPQIHDHMNSDDTPFYTILNMRGNALSYNKQRLFLATVSTLVYAFVPYNQLSVVSDDLTSYHKEFGNKSVYLLYEGDSLPTLPKQVDIKAPDFLSELCDTVLYRNDNLAQISSNITNNIVKRMQATKCMQLSLTDTISIARRLYIPVDIDEHNIIFCDSVVDNIMKVLAPHPNDTNKMPLSELKKTLLPLQNKGWAEWAESKRTGSNFYLQDSTDFTNFKNLNYAKMDLARSEQISQLENPSILLLKIMNHCRSYGTFYQEFYIVWIILQNELNSLCKQYLPPLYEEYKRLNKLSCSSEYEAVGSDDLLRESMDNCRYSLIQAGKNIAESSIGMEHIFRELGQVFEAYKHITDNVRKNNLTNHLKFKIETLSEIVAKLLFEGHAFEIMDGDVSHVPITWVMSVLRSLDLTIGPDKRIFVLSILGTQSSGKSTLLNTMFGANFPVSSGRCTRGIFMQLIPIDEKLCSQFRYDYLILLDTEGLRAPEFSVNYSYKRDNELATFAVGLGDMTIVNMFGESHSEIQDILQITVFALIRMKEISHKPRCVFVHQNVADTHAHTNLVAARSNLIKTLDQMTVSAAHQENKSALYSKFMNVIEFDPEREVFYFPGLFEGEPPLHQIALGYSKAAVKLYTYILNSYSNNQAKDFQTVKGWSKKLKTLWKSILKENFVFSYRNALEVTIRIELDHKLSLWYSRYIYKMTDWRSISVNVLLNVSPNELDGTLDRLTEELRREQISPSIQVELEQKIMEDFFIKHEHVAILIQWETNTIFYFDSKRKKLVKELEEHYKMIYNIQKNKRDVDQKFNNFREGIAEDVYCLFLDLKKDGLSPFKDNTCLENWFQSLWNKCRFRIDVESIPNHDVNKDLQRAIIESPTMNQMCVFSTKADLISDTLQYVTIGKQVFQHLSELQSPKHSNAHYYSYHDSVMKEFCQAFKKAIFSANSKEKGAKQFFNVLAILTEECERSTQEYLSDLNHKQCSYDPNSFIVVIKNCHEILTGYNAKQGKRFQKSLELTTDFFFDFIFHQCCRSIPLFQQIQDAFILRTSLDSKFLLLEAQLKENFLKLCNGIESEYLNATQLASITIEGMKDYLRDSVVNNFRSQFENDPTHASTYLSRSSLILRVLKDLARARKFEEYISYIANPFNFIKTFIQRQLEEYARRKEVIERAVQQLVRDIHSLIEFYIKANNQSTPVSCLDNEGNFKLNFHSKIKEKVRNVTLQDLDVLSTHAISNYTQFCELYSQELKKSVADTDWSLWLKTIISEEKTLYKSITDNLLECEALCPFCNEPCQLAVGEHEHYCGSFHRPKGLNGWHHHLSNKISLKECTTSIQDKGNFYYKDILYKYVDYKTVNEEFNSWKILGEDAIDSKYWQWVLFTFEDKFLEHYEVVKNESIVSWRNLTETEVVNDLEAHYHSFIFKKY